MSSNFDYSLFKHFFSEIYKVLSKVDKDINEVWQKISEFAFFNRFDKGELELFLDNFPFIKKERWGHLSINKIGFIMESMTFLDSDISHLSKILDFRNFESLIEQILIKNNYKTMRNFRFSDKSDFKYHTSQKRYEIDVIGFYNNNLLVIDAKQWRNKDSFGAINKAADLQLRRNIALKKNIEILSNLIQSKLNCPISNKFLPLNLIPIMVTLEENSYRLNLNHVPLVSVYRLNAFLQELELFMDQFKIIKVKKIIVQKQLFS